MDGELESRWGGKLIFTWSLAVQWLISSHIVPSRTPFDVQIFLLFTSSLLFFCSSVHLLVRSWNLGFGVYMGTGWGHGWPKGNIWAQKQDCLFPFRAMGFQAWRWGLCWGTALFYPVFSCLLSVSLSNIFQLKMLKIFLKLLAPNSELLLTAFTGQLGQISRLRAYMQYILFFFYHSLFLIFSLFYSLFVILYLCLLSFLLPAVN